MASRSHPPHTSLSPTLRALPGTKISQRNFDESKAPASSSAVRRRDHGLTAVKISTRDNAIVNRLNKTKVEREVDHEAERQERQRAEGRKKKNEAIERVSDFERGRIVGTQRGRRQKRLNCKCPCRVNRLLAISAGILHLGVGVAGGQAWDEAKGQPAKYHTWYAATTSPLQLSVHSRDEHFN